ncbi:Signal peptide peptidase [Camellia lanceoleosa]|uniref:Signal peptide peptidase n=1 Tax=Camellia lanceoleosa TaxID=1840588 RepID=A0ACC0J1K2_9ERIC|nr:Signal peptide peptidase [Camellia lanceoleosa]
MANYHFVYKDVEGASTQWDDIQRKLGNLPPKPPAFKPPSFKPAENEDSKHKDKARHRDCDYHRRLRLSDSIKRLCYYISSGTGTFFCAWYASQKHWLANNILGLAFCIQGIEMLSLGSFKTGAILLAGLFVYDIF